MTASVIAEIVKGVIDGARAIKQAIDRGRSWEDLTLAEIIPEEARNRIKAAAMRADDYIENG